MPGYNLSRLVRAVGSGGLVSAIEDNPQLLSRAAQGGTSGLRNVKLLASLDPEQMQQVPVDGIIIGYNPPVILQRPGLLEADPP